MRPQPAFGAALRGALSQGCAGRPAALAAQACAMHSGSAPGLRLRPARSMTKTTTPAAAAQCFFSTCTPRPAPPPPSRASAPAAQQDAPAPVLPASVLSQVLFAPSSPSTLSSSSSSSSSPTLSSSASATSKHPSVYATVYIHGRPYLVTPGDSLRLPFKMPGVQPGDQLVLNRVGVLGNRHVTAVGSAPRMAEAGAFEVPHVPGAAVKAVVLGVESEPMRVVVKKKRRTRRKRTVKSKLQFTVLRIQEVCVEE